MVLSYQRDDAHDLPGDLASTLRPRALGALARAPALLPGLVAVGWDAVRQKFISPLGTLELAALETALNETWESAVNEAPETDVNEATAARGSANHQVVIACLHRMFVIAAARLIKVTGSYGVWFLPALMLDLPSFSQLVFYFFLPIFKTLFLGTQR